MSKRVIKQLSDMAIDEVSLVDRGANQHALITIAKNYAVDDLFAKARGGVTRSSDKGTSESSASFDTHTGNDPAGVVDEYVANDGGDTGPGGKISGVQRTSSKDVNVKSAPGKTKAAPKVPGKMDDELETTLHKGEKNLPDGVDNLGENDDAILAKALGLIVDDYEIEKGFGPQTQSPFQQGAQAPQFGNPPIMQTTGAQPMGVGAPIAPPAMGGMQAGPNPQNPGMASGGPQVPGPTAQQPMQANALGGGAGIASMMGQTGAPPQLNVAQLPPEVVQYIQQLEQQLSQAQGGNTDDSSEGSDSSNDASNSDNSNKPFGKSGAFTMNEDLFLEELSKAIRDEDGRADFSKALQARFDSYEAQISKAQEVAAAERDLRLEREFIAKAAEFIVPVAPEELGPVLKRAAEHLDDADFAVIVKCLDAATELSGEVFGEVGKRGTGSNLDIFDEVTVQAQELAKNFEVSPEQATAAVFEANPTAYDQYRASQRTRF